MMALAWVGLLGLGWAFVWAWRAPSAPLGPDRVSDRWLQDHVYRHGKHWTP